MTLHHALPSHSLICIGQPLETQEYATDLLQRVFCPTRTAHPHNPCRCTICDSIAQHQSSQVTWIQPEGDYVLDTLDPLFATIRYSLEPGTFHAFVLADAHTLSVACANRLLKIVEEPPRGYFFLFLTTDYHALLSTIQSRSMIVYQSPHDTQAHNTLLSFFTDPEKQNDPVAFDTFLKTESISVAHAKKTIQQLALLPLFDSKPEAASLKILLDHAQRNFPQPGGVQHYLRWLYMALHLLLHHE